MEIKEQDRALLTPGEESELNNNTNKEESVEGRRRKHDADSGSDGTSDTILQKENLIDPGNEHHRNDADAIIPGKNTDRSPRHDADSGGDASGTMGSEPDKEK